MLKLVVHLSVNNKTAIMDVDNIMFAEECEAEEENNHVKFTRIYLKEPLPGQKPTQIIDVTESVDTIYKRCR